MINQDLNYEVIFEFFSKLKYSLEILELEETDIQYEKKKLFSLEDNNKKETKQD